MHIEYDEAKRGHHAARAWPSILLTRLVFWTVLRWSQLDSRADYGEPRTTSMGMLDGRVGVRVWTPRGKARRIIFMRYANERERQNF